MFRVTSAKQMKAQTQAKQLNKQIMLGVVQEKTVLNYINMQPTNLARI